MPPKAAAATKTVRSTSAGFTAPMLATEWSASACPLEHGKALVVQPKLDGVRVVAWWAGGTVKLATRNGNDVPGFAEVRSAVETVLKQPENLGLVLDGEMYEHGVLFEELVSRFRHGSHLRFHVFDVYDRARPQLDAGERIMRVLPDLFPGSISSGPVSRVPSTSMRLQDCDELAGIAEKYRDEGYEGVIVRPLRNSPYEPGKRSKNLFKLKPFLTDEFPIVGVAEARGQDAGTAVFVCSSSHESHESHETSTGQGTPPTFRVRLRASRERRRELFAVFQRQPRRLLGKLLTVRYQEMTAAGVPRFPVGIAIRDYE